MMEARDFAASVGLQGDEPAWAQICGNLDTRLVMHVHGKTAPTRKKFSNLNEIAVTFYDELLAAFPEQVKAVACPWVAVPLATPEAKTKAPEFDGIRELNARGIITKTMITQAGFNLEDKVMSPEGATYTLLELASTNAKLKPEEDG